MKSAQDVHSGGGHFLGTLEQRGCKQTVQTNDFSHDEVRYPLSDRRLDISIGVRKGEMSESCCRRIGMSGWLR